jgi:hypothetical protein
MVRHDLGGDLMDVLDDGLSIAVAVDVVVLSHYL